MSLIQTNEDRLLSEAEASELAHRILGAAPSGPGEFEVTVDSARDAFARYAKEGPTQSADRDRVDVAIRVRMPDPAGGYREARVEAVAPDHARLPSLYERALELARVSPVDSGALPLGGEVSVAETRTLDRATLEHGFEEKAEWIAKALEACRNEHLAGAGLLRTTSMSRAIVNSGGRSVFGRRQRASASLTTIDVAEGVEGFGETIASGIRGLDGEAALRAAVEKAVRGRKPVAHEAGEEVVVMEPHAVSALLYFGAHYGFGGREYGEGSSFMSGRLGESAFSEQVTLNDDVHNAMYPAMPFDGEGTPRLRTRLVEAGKLVGPVTDQRTAHELGLACSGHAPPQPSSDGPLPEMLVLNPGSESLEELIAGVDRGLFVTNLHYVNVIDPKKLTLTGMTRSGTFRIEKGKITNPVRNLRFTDDLPRLLSRVSGLGVEQQVGGSLFDGEIVAPAMRIDGMRFTSGTDF